MLWLKSQSTEAWLDRRTNYSQTLSVMSMAGYILGLGDRHMRYNACLRYQCCTQQIKPVNLCQPGFVVPSHPCS